MAMSIGVTLGIYEKALIACSEWSPFFSQVIDGGFSFVDLSIDESPQRASRLSWSASERINCRSAAEANGVDIGALCLSLHRKIMPGSIDPDMRSRALEVYRNGIDLAGDLGVNVVQVAGYFAHYEPRDPDARSRYIDTLAAAVPHAARSGIILAIENVDGHDIASIPDAMSVVQEINSPWVQCYPDIGNIAEHGGSATHELRAGEGHMVALHVKDVLPGEPRRIPFGMGVADFDSAFTELARQQWSGRMMLEMWNDDHPDSVAICKQARYFIEEKLSLANIPILSSRRNQQ
ncbi:MAG: L-ribulose-5-phosphate 3-epimerase [Propionibacteriaceae bacterium]